MSKTMMLTLVAAGAWLALPAFAAKGNDPGANDPGGAPRVKLTPEQRFLGELRQAMEVASNDEWSVLEPRIIRVATLARQVRELRDSKKAMEGPKPPKGGELAVDPPRCLMELADKARDLRNALADPATRPPEFRYYLTIFRKARTAAESELTRQLTQAREELRELVTARQETALIMRGLLD